MQLRLTQDQRQTCQTLLWEEIDFGIRFRLFLFSEYRKISKKGAVKVKAML
jgi:hypothetical protein